MPKKTVKKTAPKNQSTANKRRFGILPKRRPFTRTPRDNGGLPTAWRLLGRTYLFVVRNWKVMGLITFIYALLYFMFVRVTTPENIDNYADLVDEILPDVAPRLKTITLAGLALTSASQSATDLGAFQNILLMVMMSLVVVWTLRHIFAGKSFRVRDAFYSSQTGLIPYMLLIMLALIQLIPFALGGGLYSVVKAQGVTVNGFEDLIFVGIWVLLSTLSAFWLTNTIMALYAVTIPGVYPLQALRATKKLVAHRRWFVFRKILFLPVVLTIVFGALFLFLIEVARGTVFWYLDVAYIAILPLVHVYLYQLYRSLL